ncbi:MAG TPA: YeeE/YedE thiosulfate transporter family protein [Thiobacillaceae bacterium]|nr:YeeE/YedE thiosulfate transporter family protein [Thiobacillaceae bacterium]HNA82664.1 YeeE/YedE thiosulfate transporter family protein [Thiobacillaceae bacterium]HNF88597.1 YeeE/YedE thiosulfate transporter family protein [Thiobacillaceae bacterium]HNH89884.1 YeeE/YedE thiosulfate transporter family protein [Thiobacillaceae bacterium]HNI07746.1 YeeE/YedE thiosulfate transporter family protein [Thiobacillaceae bacterium]
MFRYLPYLLVGILFGFVLVKSEAASWYRIQEMFHFQNFHMFGILFSAIATGVVSIQIIKRLGRKKALDGQAIDIPEKAPGTVSYVVGGLIFGFGWGLIGLCPGPMFALAGTGSLGAMVVLAGSLHGTWLYGALKQHLPH